MKRSSLKQVRTFFALSSVLALLASGLVGCAGEDVKQTPEESNPVSTLATETTPEATDATEPSSTDAASTMGTVNTDQLNVRSNPDSDSPSVEKLALGTRLEILEQKSVDDITWGRIENGWVNMKYVTLDNAQSGTVTPEPSQPDETTAPDSDDTSTTKPGSSTTGTDTGSSTTGTVTANVLNIRSGPGTSYATAGSVKKGNTVTIYETSGNWARIDGGWVSLKYVKVKGSTSTTTTTTTNTTGTVTDVVTDSNTKALGNVVVGSSALNVRSGPGTKYVKVSTVKAGQTLAYYQKDGNWVRVEGGWISLGYASIQGSGSTSTGTSTGKVGVVIGTELNIRSAAGTTSSKVGAYKLGDQITITEQTTVDGSTWGKTSKGWVSLKYVYIQGDTGSNSGTGTVTADVLNVRSGPGKNYSSTGAVKNGDSVNILTQITIGDATWGYTGSGWVSMQYVKMK